MLDYFESDHSLKKKNKTFKSVFFGNILECVFIYVNKDANYRF